MNTVPSEEMTYRAFVKEKLESIERQTMATNGKVRKIIMAIILLAGITIGLGFTEAKLLLPLIV